MAFQAERTDKGIKHDKGFKGELPGRGEGSARGKGGGQRSDCEVNIYAKLKRLNFIPQIRSL